MCYSLTWKVSTKVILHFIISWFINKIFFSKQELFTILQKIQKKTLKNRDKEKITNKLHTFNIWNMFPFVTVLMSSISSATQWIWGNFKHV